MPYTTPTADHANRKNGAASNPQASRRQQARTRNPQASRRNPEYISKPPAEPPDDFRMAMLVAAVMTPIGAGAGFAFAALMRFVA